MYHYVPTRISQVNIMTMPKACEAMEKLYHSYVASGNVKWSATLKTVCQILINHICIRYITWQLSSWSFVPEKWKVVFTRQPVHKHVWDSATVEVTQVPSISEKIDKLWYILTLESYSAIKRNRLFRHTTTWMDLQRIRLSEKQTISKKLNMDVSFYIAFLIL